MPRLPATPAGPKLGHGGAGGSKSAALGLLALLPLLGRRRRFLPQASCCRPAQWCSQPRRAAQRSPAAGRDGCLAPRPPLLYSSAASAFLHCFPCWPLRSCLSAHAEKSDFLIKRLFLKLKQPTE